MIERRLSQKILSKLFKGKAIIVLGPRQSGKSTLLRTLTNDLDDVLWLNADEGDIRELFSAPNSRQLKARFAGAALVVIDEAQRIHDIGIKLKLITDQIPDVQLIVTGSSAFELSNSINEPLTGRKWEYMLYPLSYGEMCRHHSPLTERRLLLHRLTYGYYPEVATSEGEERDVLLMLSESYLYKDILMWQGIKKPDKLVTLVKALALQMGNEVSYNELAGTVGLDKETIEKYIQVLEKAFIIFKVNAFSRNLRSELKRSRKVYFYDLGMRNSILAAFGEFELRQDKGALWENFLISERLKYLDYEGIWTNTYFWRTHAQAEIDWIEERDGQLHAFEFKWKEGKRSKPPLAFTKAYPEATFETITPDNFEVFLGVGA